MSRAAQQAEQAVAVAEITAAAEARERACGFYLLVTEAQCTELSFGRVPGEVREMARTMVDWTQEDARRNAAKPVRLARRGR